LAGSMFIRNQSNKFGDYEITFSHREEVYNLICNFFA